MFYLNSCTFFNKFFSNQIDFQNQLVSNLCYQIHFLTQMQDTYQIKNKVNNRKVHHLNNFVSNTKLHQYCIEKTKR